MDKFEIHILGCGSATPTVFHNPSAQVIDYREKLFLVDCGEGTQVEFRRNKLRFGKLHSIFISHLHGDHCFGLIGLISSLSLLGRTGDLTIYSPIGLEELLVPQIKYFCAEMPYKVIFKPFDTTKSKCIYEDRSITVCTIPLHHRVPCAGFLFREKQKDPNLDKNLLDFHNVPQKEIKSIKEGADFVKENGMIIPNHKFIKGRVHSRSYAYCSDTAYSPLIVPIIKNVDLLYHEATFLHDLLPLATKTLHTTAHQAATIAKNANVGELMLGHFSARYKDNRELLVEAKKVFENIILAKEGLTVNIEMKRL